MSKSHHVFFNRRPWLFVVLRLVVGPCVVFFFFRTCNSVDFFFEAPVPPISLFRIFRNMPIWAPSSSWLETAGHSGVWFPLRGSVDEEPSGAAAWRGHRCARGPGVPPIGQGLGFLVFTSDMFCFRRFFGLFSPELRFGWTPFMATFVGTAVCGGEHVGGFFGQTEASFLTFSPLWFFTALHNVKPQQNGGMGGEGGAVCPRL